MTKERKPQKFINRFDSRYIVRPLPNNLYGEAEKAAEEGRLVGMERDQLVGGGCCHAGHGASLRSILRIGLPFELLQA